MPSIELTPKQYKTLLQTLFLGNWMANSMKVDDSKDDFEELEQYILSYGKQFKADKYIDYDENFKTYFTTRALEEELDSIIDEYDDYTFWEELAGKLAQRDLKNEIGPVRELTEKHMERQFNIEENYNEEFNKNGLKNLILQVQENKKMIKQKK